MRVAVLASGNGSNLQALVDACIGDFPARIVAVLSNVPDAKAIERAKTAGIPTIVVDHRTFSDKTSFDQALVAALRPFNVDLIVLAGYMRIIGPEFLNAYPKRIINIHPSLLPSFPGLHSVRQALTYGVKWTGCTVHLVDGGVDTGPIIAQRAIPVLDNDSEEILLARMHRAEHQLLPQVVALFARQQIQFIERRTQCLDPNFRSAGIE